MKIWLASLAARLVAVAGLEYLALIGSYFALAALAAVLVMEGLVLTKPALRGELRDGSPWARHRRQ